MNFFKFTSLIVVFLVLGCTESSDPSPKGVPFEPVKKADKKLDDVLFNNKIDILFVIDDSGSMFDYQTILAQNARVFIDQFLQAKFIDYHIAVTTSSLFAGGSVANSGKLHEVDGFRWVDRTMNEGPRVLEDMLRVGDNGSATEYFFDPFILALGPALTKGANQGFYRPDAHLGIFTLTDSGDQGTYSAQQAYDFLLDLKKNDEKKLHYAAAIIEVEGPGCSKQGEPQPTKMIELIDLHNDQGYRFELCKDYGSELAKLAQAIVRSVSTVYLDQLPDVETIKVTYGKLVIPNDPEKGWTYNPDNNSIFLSPKINFKDLDPQELKITFEAIYK